MFIALRKSTVIFLAILQLIAPLVHAHAGDKISDLGLHVPGLEMYGVEHAMPEYQAVNYAFHSDGIIVGVDAGMKDKQVIVDLDGGHYLHRQAPVFNAAISPFDANFSPQSQQLVCRLFIPSLSPRAPPAQ